jgi:hypothetical protein
MDEFVVVDPNLVMATQMLTWDIEGMAAPS